MNIEQILIEELLCEPLSETETIEAERIAEIKGWNQDNYSTIVEV